MRRIVFEHKIAFVSFQIFIEIGLLNLLNTILKGLTSNQFFLVKCSTGYDDFLLQIAQALSKCCDYRVFLRLVSEKRKLKIAIKF